MADGGLSLTPLDGGQLEAGEARLRPPPGTAGGRMLRPRG
jgi:hypothetical protein